MKRERLAWGMKMAITEFDLFRLQLAIDSSCYKTPQKRKKEQQQQKTNQLNTRRQAEYQVISRQFDTRARQTFMEKYGSTQGNTQSADSFSSLDTQAIKDSVAARIEVQTQAQIEKIIDTPARRAFMQKYGQSNGQLQNDQVTLSQEALSKLLAEKFPAEAAPSSSAAATAGSSDESATADSEDQGGKQA